MNYYGLYGDQNFGPNWEDEFAWKHEHLKRESGYPFWEDEIREITIPLDDPDDVLGRKLDYFATFALLKGPIPVPVVSRRFIELIGEKDFDDAYWRIPLTLNGHNLEGICGFYFKPGTMVEEPPRSELFTKPIHASMFYDVIVPKDTMKKLKRLKMPNCKWVKLK